MGLREVVSAPLRSRFLHRASWNSAIDVDLNADVESAIPLTRGVQPEHAYFTVVDVETTGLDPSVSRVIQLAAVRIGWDGRIVDTFDTIVRPESPDEYEHGAEHIHGISAAQVADGMPVGEALLRLRSRLEGSVLTGHNVRFDIGFLAAEGARTGVSLPMTSWIDTLWLARQLDPDKTHSHRLSALCERFGIPVTRSHDALADATATASLLMTLLPQHGIGSPDELHRIVRTGGA